MATAAEIAGAVEQRIAIITRELAGLEAARHALVPRRPAAHQRPVEPNVTTDDVDQRAIPRAGDAPRVRIAVLAVLAKADSDGVSTATIARLSRCSRPLVMRALKELHDADMAFRTGAGRSTRWISRSQL